MKDLDLYNLQKFYSNFNDLSRLKIIIDLLDKTLTIEEICENSNLSPIPVEVQLEYLERNKIVMAFERDELTYYTLDERVNKRIKSDIRYLSKRK